MMKKAYSSPASRAFTLEPLEKMLATSVGLSDDTIKNQSEILSNKREGWNSIWDEAEEGEAK